MTRIMSAVRAARGVSPRLWLRKAGHIAAHLQCAWHGAASRQQSRLPPSMATLVAASAVLLLTASCNGSRASGQAATTTAPPRNGTSGARGTPWLIANAYSGEADELRF